MPTRSKGKYELRRRASWIGLGVALCVFQPAYAQDDPYQSLTDTKPALSPRDENGVDLVSGKLGVDVPLLAVSKDATSLTLSLNISGPVDWPIGGSNVEAAFGLVFAESHNFYMRSSAPVTPDLGAISFVSSPIGSGAYRANIGWAITNPDGSKFLPSLGPTNITYFLSGPYQGYRAADGTGMQTTLGGCCTEIPTRIDLPNGEIWKVYFQTLTGGGLRLRSVTTNRGYTYEIEYQSDSSAGAWSVPTRVLVFNKAKVYCNEAALALCSNTTTAIDYVDFVYDNTSKSVTFRHKGRTGGLRIGFRPESFGVSTDVQSVSQSDVPNSTVNYAYAINDEEGNDPYYERHVASATRSEGTWSYTYYRTMHEGRIIAESHMDVTGPLGMTRNAVGNLSFGLLDWITEPLGRTFTQGYDVNNGLRITDEGRPQGNGVHYERDYRGNATKLQYIPKSGSSDPLSEVTATYPSDCMNPKTCNHPLTITDARGASTTFTYDSTHGGVLTKTLPAVGGISPVTRYAYTQRHSWLKNASGGYTATPEGVWLLAEERTCRATATVSNTCAGGTADEVVTTYDYGPDSGPSNLLLRGTTVTADGQTLRTCYGTNDRGDRVSETSPRAMLTSCP